MPLLPQEPSIFPDDLFDAVVPGREGCRWWALQTRPRAEKALARRLVTRNCSFFLPVYQKKWCKHGRMFCAYLPLFPGYVFLHGDFQDRQHAVETNLVARVLHAEDQEQLHDDLARVHHLMASGVSMAPEERLQPGMFVEIVSGPLAGMEGKIVKRNKKTRFFLEVQFVKQGVSVEVDGWMIQPLAEQRPVSLATG